MLVNNRYDSRNIPVPALSLGELLLATAGWDSSETEDGGSGLVNKGGSIDTYDCPDKDNCTPPVTNTDTH
ncbi:MAG: hypothetical protein E6J90_35560 [Deltaproteobacteria bacterium]|nr:MAG: hypothetical protein E6J90_35560 [Deltaproteobacteria bacterium]TMQ18507.1 MAG: hypothetical protein E6J91_07770 [Deltaproteobacteria bacterium]